MIKITPTSVSSLKIAVTSTAANLFTLMDTAGSLAAETNQNYYLGKKANAILINPEDGDIRILYGADPSASVGSLLKSGTSYYFPGVNLSDLRLIRVGGSNVNCSVEPYISEPSESPFAVAGGGTVTIDEFPAASAASDNYANPTTTDVKSFGMLWDGATWDRMPGDSTYGIKTQDTLIPQAYDNTIAIVKTVNAPLTGSTYTWSSDSSSALEASSVVKASAGNLRLFSGVIDASLASGTYYLQFFNQTSVPADTTAIAANFIAPTVVKHTNGTPTPINLDFTNNCLAFSAGLVWCLSSTFYTKTITSAVVNATVLYK